MALLHALINGLRMKITCRHKEGITLRHCYLTMNYITVDLIGACPCALLLSV